MHHAALGTDEAGQRIARRDFGFDARAAIAAEIQVWLLKVRELYLTIRS
jgi:hypothetical protein